MCCCHCSSGRERGPHLQEAPGGGGPGGAWGLEAVVGFTPSLKLSWEAPRWTPRTPKFCCISGGAPGEWGGQRPSRERPTPGSTDAGTQAGHGEVSAPEGHPRRPHTRWEEGRSPLTGTTFSLLSRPLYRRGNIHKHHPHWSGAGPASGDRQLDLWTPPSEGRSPRGLRSKPKCPQLI